MSKAVVCSPRIDRSLYSIFTTFETFKMIQNRDTLYMALWGNKCYRVISCLFMNTQRQLLCPIRFLVSSSAELMRIHYTRNVTPVPPDIRMVISLAKEQSLLFTNRSILAISTESQLSPVVVLVVVVVIAVILFFVIDVAVIVVIVIIIINVIIVVVVDSAVFVEICCPLSINKYLNKKYLF